MLWEPVALFPKLPAPAASPESQSVVRRLWLLTSEAGVISETLRELRDAK